MLPYIIKSGGDMAALHRKHGDRFVLNGGPEGVWPFKGYVLYTASVGDISTILSDGELWPAGWNSAHLNHGAADARGGVRVTCMMRMKYHGSHCCHSLCACILQWWLLLVAHSAAQKSLAMRMITALGHVPSL
jgi:hypothetical protein